LVGGGRGVRHGTDGAAVSGTYVCDWPHEMHPGRRDHTAVLGCRIDELSDDERRLLLHFLSGYSPAGVELALERADGAA
jgi:hypothetical protein